MEWHSYFVPSLSSRLLSCLSPSSFSLAAQAVAWTRWNIAFSRSQPGWDELRSGAYHGGGRWSGRVVHGVGPPSLSPASRQFRGRRRSEGSASAGADAEAPSTSAAAWAWRTRAQGRGGAGWKAAYFLKVIRDRMNMKYIEEVVW
jgi:hypothetical protein